MYELSWIARFFTSTVFKSVVVVATVSPPLSKMDIPNDIKLPPEDTAKTKDNFAQALEEVLAGVSDLSFHSVIHVSNSSPKSKEQQCSMNTYSSQLITRVALNDWCCAESACYVLHVCRWEYNST